MKRAGAVRVWGLSVIWVAGGEQAALTAATAAAAEPVEIHYHLHLEAGADVAAILRQAAESGTVVPEIRE